LPPKNSRRVADLPEHLDLGRHRDASWWSELGARWVVLGLLTAIAVAALFSVFGQHPETSVASGDAADLEVYAPQEVRGGLFFEGRFTVTARDGIEDAVIVLAPGWMENMHINTIEPAPTEEASRNGRLALHFGPLGAGERLVLYVQFQVNPTNVGRRSADVELYDGESLIVTVDRTMTVFP
jgi:hypothetical protein